MADYATTIVQARMQEVNAKLTARMKEISSRSGIQFSDMFAQRLAAVTMAAPTTVYTPTDAEKAAAQAAYAAGTGSTSSASSAAAALSTGNAPSIDDITDAILNSADSSTTATTTAPAPVTIPSVASRSDYSELIAENAAKYSVNPELIRAVIWAESNFDANAVGAKTGTLGLMQIMPYVAKSMGITDGLDPAQNIDGGTRILAEKLAMYDGNLRMSLASYNMGAAGLAKTGVTDLSDDEQLARLPNETRYYIAKIEAFLGY
ncbi:hypothetical protein FACS1894217_09430 [Clostridia bacterium]|nr:hypothetical protein FACS1894217_09430 [Clostridia bacterium]